MLHDTTPGTPTLLSGAFDRYNLGDQLFPPVAAASDRATLWQPRSGRRLR